MRKISTVILKFFLVFLFCSNLTAGSIFITPGAKANAMGGAFSAVADDITAIYWNPAGLSQLQGNGFGLSAFYVSKNAKSNTSLANTAVPDNADGDFPIALLSAVEPTMFESKKFETSAFLPFAAGYTNINDITLAVGFYAIGGGGGKWEDSVTDLSATGTIDASIDASYGFMVGNISASKYLSDKLSLGLGLNLIYMINQANVKKAYTAGSTTVYSIEQDLDAAGTGFEVTAGALFHLTETIQLGGVFRSGASVNLDGTSKLNTLGLGPAIPDMNYSTDYEQEYAYPLSYGIGLAYLPTELLILSVALDMTNHSVVKDDIDYEQEIAGLIDDVNSKKGWEDTTQIRLGCDYMLTEKISLRGGVEIDPAPTPSGKLTLISTEQYSFTSLCLGMGYTLEKIQLDMNYIHSFDDNPESNNRSYEYPLDIVRITIGYNF
ncbi:OmpP1/FadL family transporter [bacterium]